MKKVAFALTVCSLLLLPLATAQAQTVTVAKTVAADYTTIQAAIDSFDPDPDINVANRVEILDATVYEEIFTIDVPVEIEGTDASRPILAVQENPATIGDGIFIQMDNGETFNDVTLRNLIIIPSLTNPPGDDGIYSVGQNLNIFLENVVITANDGTNQPVTEDGLAPVDLYAIPGAVTFGDDGGFLGSGTGIAGDGTVVRFRHTVVSHNQAIAGGTGSTNGDGLVCSTTNEGKYIMENGTVFSYNGRLGIQANSEFIISASDDDRVQVIGNGINTGAFAGIWYAGFGASQTERIIEGCNVLNNTDPESTAQGWGIEQQNGGDLPLTLRNVIIAGNQAQGLLVGSVGTAGDITLENVTIANNGGAALQTDAASIGNINITDTIIAGPSVGDATGIQHSGAGTITLNTSAIVNTGPYAAVPATENLGTGSIVENSVIGARPRFIETADFTSADYYDVDSPDYGGQGSAGSDLSGGADYIGSYVPPPVTGVQTDEWSNLK